MKNLKALNPIYQDSLCEYLKSSGAEAYYLCASESAKKWIEHWAQDLYGRDRIDNLQEFEDEKEAIIEEMTPEDCRYIAQGNLGPQWMAVWEIIAEAKEHRIPVGMEDNMGGSEGVTKT